MKHSYVTCDRCKKTIDDGGAAVLQFTKYNGRGETEKLKLFDLCVSCYFVLIAVATNERIAIPLDDIK